MELLKRKSSKLRQRDLCGSAYQAYIHGQRQSLRFIIKITISQDLTMYIAPTTIYEHTQLLELDLSLTSSRPLLVYVEIVDQSNSLSTPYIYINCRVLILIIVGCTPMVSIAYQGILSQDRKSVV